METRASSTREEEDLAGTSIRVTDQTVTPLQVRLRIAAAADEIERGHCRLGEQTPYGAATRRRRLHTLDVSAIERAYEVEIHAS